MFIPQVKDENDESPKFSQTLYRAKVNETALGSHVGDVYITSVHATDDDVGENARVSYRILDDPRNEFTILDDGSVYAVRGQ
jgi:hypothetical protein